MGAFAQEAAILTDRRLPAGVSRIIARVRRASRFWLWTLPALIGLVGALALSTTFLLALRGARGSPLGVAPPPPKEVPAPAAKPGRRLVLILGDSLARGTGDPSGRGWSLDVLDEIRRRVPADSSNLAVNGWESADVRRLVERQNVRALAARASMILLSVGGNDLSHSLPRSAGPAPVAVDAVEKGRQAFLANLKAILQTLRTENRTAPIYLLGLYDPFQLAGAEGRLGASVILQWNAEMAQVANLVDNVRVIPTFDLFQGRMDRLGADRFHPNREGYAAIAARAIQSLPAQL
jgi:lysophospholipase L1-like esterase